MGGLADVTFFTVATYPDFYGNITLRNLVLPTDGTGAADPIKSNYGPCFIPNTSCRLDTTTV